MKAEMEVSSKKKKKYYKVVTSSTSDVTLFGNGVVADVIS